jgi:hypothetical protein
MLITIAYPVPTIRTKNKVVPENKGPSNIYLNSRITMGRVPIQNMNIVINSLARDTSLKSTFCLLLRRLSATNFIFFIALTNIATLMNQSTVSIKNAN